MDHSYRWVFGAVLAGAMAIGCAESAPEAETPVQVEQQSLKREDAIARARHDAALRYGAIAGGEAITNRAGDFWIVELRGLGTGSVRYTISSQDGSIRERNLRN